MMKMPSLSRSFWSPSTKNRLVDAFLARPALDPHALSVAAELLESIRAQGDAALLAAARRFDTPKLKASQIRIQPEELKAATREVDADFKRQAQEANRRIFAFARAGMRKDWTMKTPQGGLVGERFQPLDRVGVYIPGGTAPLASTSLMTATLARAAGVPEIVGCTPADAQGRVNPYVLYTMQLAGVTEMYRVGGVQAIGAMAYGTKTIAKVQKIVGPGNAYVTAAKKLVYGEVALDSVAGPSEVAILADESARPAHVAADLLAQAEHGTGKEKALLVSTSAGLVEQVIEELPRQAAQLSRVERVLPVLEQGLLMVTVASLEDGVELINRFAAEHLELLVRNPKRLLKSIRAAGAIFLGPWTPECAGDFVAGPSHVLPTGGAAAMFSGLSAEDFRRRSSVIHLKQADLAEMLPVIEAFGRVEGLDGHSRSATIRFEAT